MADLLRPTFECTVPVEPARAEGLIRGVYERDGSPFVGQSVRSHMLITVERGRRHFWSPWVHVDVNPASDDSHASHVYARFSPAPSVWTGFMLTYIALLTIAMITGCWAFSQWMLDQPPTMLWGVAIPALLAIAMLWSARVGQRLARAQMRMLHDAVRGALEPAGDSSVGS